jgi:L-seryl-tRNA(Ser) seleniumtransferase
MGELRNLPGVDKLLHLPKIKEMANEHNETLVKHAIRETLTYLRKKALKENNVPPLDDIIEHIRSVIQNITSKSLRNVMNATGVVVHTNLGRAPFSDDIIAEVSEILKGYSNLEYDLQKGERGSRNSHVTQLLTYLTGAEDVLVVNNNAAALMLMLRTFAKDKEVVVSRGELIEIGGSFRLPDIMAASDCKMVEVGTTNKTKILDYENAITDETAMLFKAHTSNYVIQGFTHEAKLQELVALGKKKKIPVVYDMGSGLLRKTSVEIFRDEPDVSKTIKTGVDIVSFSGDKLLGGPQAGIIAGKKEYISILKKEPMVRALRVGKTTLAFMEAALSYYLDDKILTKKNTIFSMMSKKPEEIKANAELLQSELKKYDIESTIVKGSGQCGGGALPGETIESFAVRIDGDFQSNKKKSEFAEKLYFGLLHYESPVVGILRKGDVYFDLLTIPAGQIEKLAEIINAVNNKILNK